MDTTCGSGVNRSDVDGAVAAHMLQAKAATQAPAAAAAAPAATPAHRALVSVEHLLVVVVDLRVYQRCGSDS